MLKATNMEEIQRNEIELRKYYPVGKKILVNCLSLSQQYFIKHICTHHVIPLYLLFCGYNFILSFHKMFDFINLILTEDLCLRFLHIIK